MKKSFNISILLWVLCPYWAMAQGTWVSYSTQLPTKDYWGHKFKFSASVKTDELDQNAAAQLWVRVDKPTQGSAFFANMKNKPIKAKEWKTYSIEGVIDSNTTKIAFGALSDFNGLSYYDDMKLEVETSKDTWKTVYFNDFEQDKHNLQEGIQLPIDDGKNTNFTANLEKKGKNQYLKIEGGGVIDYGKNAVVGKFAEVNGNKIYYEIYGQGQPLIILHDFPSTMMTQAAYYPELMKKYQLILVDMRGQNSTIRLNKDQVLTYEVMAADINEWMEQLKMDSAYIFGVLAGAKVGLLMAKDYPKRVKKLLTYGLFTQSDSTAVKPSYFKRWEDMAKQTSLEFHIRMVVDLLLERDAFIIPYSALSTIKIPVLLVNGDLGLIRIEHTLNLSKSLPNARLCILPGASRIIINEKNKAFLSIMEDFFGN
jgi:pimeloyl-ACP methyl ester carboxylesterase